MKNVGPNLFFRRTQKRYCSMYQCNFREVKSFKTFRWKKSLSDCPFIDVTAAMFATAMLAGHYSHNKTTVLST